MDDPSAESDILSDISNNAENLDVYTVDIAVALLENLVEFLEDEGVSIVFIMSTLFLPIHKTHIHLEIYCIQIFFRF